MSVTAFRLESIAVGQEQQAVSALDNAASGWDAYRQFARGLQGRTAHRMTNTKPGGQAVQVGAITNVYKRLDGYVLRVREQETVRGRGREVAGSNSKYTFTLSAAAGTDKWVLRGLAQTSEKGYEASAADVLIDAEKFICAHFFVDGTKPLWDLVRHPGFRIKRVESHPAGSGTAIRVEFEFAPQQNDASSLRGGWIDLDPDQYWYIIKSETRHHFLDGDGVCVTTNRVLPDGHRRPILEQQITEIRVNHPTMGTQTRARVLDCELAEKHDLAESEFTLSAFGLPEPVGVNWDRPKPRYWIWIIGASAGCAALGFLFAWLRRLRLRARTA